MTLSAIARSGAAVVTAAVMTIASTQPVLPAQADIDLLQSYVGNWRGSGVMTNGNNPEESVRCRLDVTRSSDTKIGFSGRCTVAGGNLSMNGTMAYINNRYEAVMTSNTAFSGTAIGRRSGSNVSFNLRAQDDNGQFSNVSARFGLTGGKIQVRFTVTNDDGSRLVADVPFEKQG